MRSAIGILLAGLVVAAPAAADEREDRERDLRAFFENHRVKVLIDMPATSKGVDVDTAAPEPERVAFGKVSERIGQTGASIREGAIVPITKINLKDDTIEFQLGGGGFNSFWNSSGTVSPTYRGKSVRERDLEREIRNEKDPKRKRDLERDLRYERERREDDERRERDIAERENEIRRERDHDRAMSMGSRFNVRFEKKAYGRFATPQAVMEILSPWVDFYGLPDAPRRHHGGDSRGGRDDYASDEGGELRPGMSRGDVQARLGAPQSERSTRDGDLHKSVAVFRDGGRRLEVTFVNGVLVQFRELD